MNQKKKQSIVAVVATVLTVTCVISPCASVYATETDTTPQQNETSIIKSAQENKKVLIDKDTFPDEGFRNYVKTYFHKSEGAEITDEIAKATNISIYNESAITDLTGIEHFTSLEWLHCYNTGIQDLDVSSNEALTYLDCSENANLKKLTVKGATALTTLWCSETGIQKLDVSGNPDLKYLNCRSTGIQDLDVSSNPALIELLCYNTGIQDLDVSSNEALTYLDCSENANLKELTVKGATALTELYCYNTGITSLDVSQNAKLTRLDCDNNGKLANLTVAGATELTALYCYNTGITSLDVSQNAKLTRLDCDNNGKLANLTVAGATELTILYCYNTGISDLDVSKNTKLTRLDCSNTPLAYLNLGTNTNLTDLYMNDLKPVDIEVPVDTFNVTDIFPGIITKNITDINGADYNEGVMSNYEKTKTKTITYKYDCGANKTINVTLNLTLKSVISIKEDLSKTYDGTAVTPEVEKEGSTKDVTYQWERKKNANDWEDIASAPKNVGTYRVTATLPSEDGYTGATSEPKEFTISQANNSWTDTLSITGWTYGETAREPKAAAEYGDVTFSYSDGENGKFISDKPINAGTWYVKASVAETENYTGLETILAFKIEAKNVENNKITVSDINNDKDVENLVIKDGDTELVKGTDYEVEKKQKGNKVDVIITFKGNYTGTITKSYTANSVSAGDTTSVVLWSTILAFSAVLVVFLKRKKYKEQTEE